jgi:hypothetical protein
VSRLTGLITGFAAGASVTGMVGLYLLLQCAGYRLGVGGLAVGGPAAGLVLLYTMNFADSINTLIRSQVTETDRTIAQLSLVQEDSLWILRGVYGVGGACRRSWRWTCTLLGTSYMGNRERGSTYASMPRWMYPFLIAVGALCAGGVFAGGAGDGPEQRGAHRRVPATPAGEA